MIDSKFTDYGPANSGTCLPSCDKEQPKKAAFRDLQNDNRIMVPKPPGNPSFLKDRGPIMEASMASSIKRPATDCAQSSICTQTPISSGANGHLVYVRRKSEQELPPKINNCEKEKKIDCAQQGQQEQETPQLQAQSESAKISCFPAFTPASVTSPVTTSGGPSPFLVKPFNKLSSGEPNHCANTSGVPHPGNSQGTGDQHWKERFLRLQTHLRNCDGSSQLEYIKMLQSLTPVGRSKHAVELEKRAIQLLLEEGHELMRMKHLNVLGKSVPINSASPLTKQFKTE